MIGAWSNDDQRPAVGQDAASLGGVARREDAQHDRGRAIRERERPPDVRAECRRPRVSPGGAPQRGW